MNTVDLYF